MDESTKKFEREKLCYEQNFLQARALNSQMVQIPIVSITLTGGLWYGGVAITGIPELASFGLLFLAFLTNLSLILSTFRVRQVFKCYLDKIEEFCPTSFVNGKPNAAKRPLLQDNSMASLLCFQLFLAALFSAFAAMNYYWPFESNQCVGYIIIFGIVIAFLALLFGWTSGVKTE